MAALMWISHSRRPLQADELSHAITIRIGSDGLNIDDFPAISTLLNCCQGFATIEKGTLTIRLIHFTLQEYLCAHPDIFNGAHATMESCLPYLNFPSVKCLSADSSPHPRGTPFLEYSSLYWGTHMQMELSDLAKHLRFSFLISSIITYLLDSFGSRAARSSSAGCILGNYSSSQGVFSAALYLVLRHHRTCKYHDQNEQIGCERSG